MTDKEHEAYLTELRADPERRNWRVVETDNFGGDYPDESFHGPHMTKAEAQSVADVFNAASGAAHGGRRYYKVVGYGYKLEPGFEP